MSKEKSPEPEENKENLIATRGGLSVESMRPAVDLMLQHMQRFMEIPKGSKWSTTFNKVMTGNVANTLESRMPGEQAAEIVSNFTKPQLALFSKIIDMTKMMLKGKYGLNGRKNGESFWEISNPQLPDVTYPKTMKGPHNENVEVQFKEYVTFVPTTNDPYEILSEANKFYEALLRAQEKTQELAKSRNVDIKMKFMDDLYALLRLIDSAIVYVPDPETGAAALDAIKEEMDKQGVLLGARRGRATHGFDMKIDGVGFSHRLLISKAIARTMTKDYEGPRALASYDAEKLAKTIIERAESAGRLTPEQILEAI
jgi:hypothetical protein